MEKNFSIYEKPRFLLITHVNCQLLHIFRIGCIDSIIWINVAANFWLNSVRHGDYSLCLLFGNVTSKFFLPRRGKKILITLIWRKRRAKCYKFYWQSVLVAVISLCVLFDWAICQNWCIIKSMCWVLCVRRRCYRLNKFSVVKAFKRFSCSFAICVGSIELLNIIAVQHVNQLHFCSNSNKCRFLPLFDSGPSNTPANARCRRSSYFNRFNAIFSDEHCVKSSHCVSTRMCLSRVRWAFVAFS